MTYIPIKTAFEQSFTKNNIQAGFRGAGIVPHSPDAVLSKLDVVVQTPPHSPQRVGVWEPRTPRNAYEVEAQSTLIQRRLRNHPGSSASSLDEAVAQLSKGAQQIAHNMVLMQEKIGRLQSTIEEQNKRKTRKGRCLRTEESLTVGEVQEVLAKQAGGSRGNGEGLSERMQGERRCRRCKESGHNACTCNVEIEEFSDTSEE